MGLVWRCGRCRCISDSNLPIGHGQQKPLPPGWRAAYLPGRDQDGTRSEQEDVICSDCDDRLYEWLHAPHDHRCQP